MPSGPGHSPFSLTGLLVLADTLSGPNPSPGTPELSISFGCYPTVKIFGHVCAWIIAKNVIRIMEPLGTTCTAFPNSSFL
jgi:hypothetical protein